MARKKKDFGGEAGEPPMSSMIDVVFLLLIYFVVTQKPIISEAHLAVNLPSPSQEAPPKDQAPPTSIKISIGPKGYKLADNRVTIESISENLDFYGSNNGNYTVLIETNVKAYNKQLVEILDVCNKAGLSNLNIITKD